MALHDFFNKTLVVQRLKTVSGNRKNFVSTGTIDVHIQRITDEATFAQYGALQATHKCWIDLGQNVQEGDRVRDSDGRIFHVVAVNHQDFGMNTHTEVILKFPDA
ncbi:hypothetical protein HY492_00065 [Candidatus Woesearchaeota archaeon]|nr:hypothetical protein [Candidatus Woesearchaeota archaeon]